MPTYLALFRGINIGGHNKLPMKALASLLETAGCKNIRTYIQSGNVIFESSRSRRKLTEEITQSISQAYGFSPAVLLLLATELQQAIVDNPFPTDVGKALHFLFLEQQPQSPDLERLNELKTKTEAFTLGEKVFYLYAPDGVGRSKLVASVERCLGVTTTGRNWNTVSKLLTMM